MFKALSNVKQVIIRWNPDCQVVRPNGGLLIGVLGEIAKKFRDFPIMYDNWKVVSEK